MTNIAQFVEKMPGSLVLEAQFVDENRYPFCLGHEFLDENRYPFCLLAAFGCSWLCFLAFGRLPGIAPGAILKTRFREAVFEPLENGPIWGAFGYFLVHWRRPGRRGRFLGFQNNA